MCGIFGFSHTTDVTRRMTPLLAWDMELRGRDSWAASSGERTIKVLGPITESFAEYEEEISTLPRAIFHTRGASVGAVTIENQHPFEFRCERDGTWVRTVIGIHNGCVVNHEALDMKYSRKHPVDSMHIYDHLANELPTEEIRGWGNLAWYEYTPAHPDGELHLLRFNNDALHIAKLFTGEIVFCSVAISIHRAALMAGSQVEKFFEVTPDRIYTPRTVLDEDGLDAQLWITKEECRFGSRFPGGPADWISDVNKIRHRYEHYSGNVRSENHRYIPTTGNVPLPALQLHERSEGICAVSGCVERVKNNRKLELICEKHFREAVA